MNKPKNKGNEPKKDNHHNGGDGDNDRGNRQPSPWLDHPLHPDGEKPIFSNNASFIEYLRWMRASDHPQKDGTKLEIMTMSQKLKYSERLQVLTARTKQLAGEGNWFTGSCEGRIRVGGYRGVESMLIPAVDALGIPFIPSSTLRGIARNVAIREFMDQGLSWEKAVQAVSPYFGNLDAPSKDQMGKVIFFDAYPSPACHNAGISSDIANNIWQWQDNKLSPYSPNPNPFFSLDKCSFVIGLKPLKPEYKDVFARVYGWLLIGLSQGIGAQSNVGYGIITVDTKIGKAIPFMTIEFAVRGQLIHGAPSFDKWHFNENKDRWESRTKNIPEVRPIAFKSMLRYWFRVIVLGVLSPEKVKELEAELFGSISPQKYGLLRVLVSKAKLKTKEPSSKEDTYGEQEGVLELYYSSELNSNKRESFLKLIKHLTWLMFHLGGIGQGSRRPLYSRKDRPKPPWWRGSNLVVFLSQDCSTEEEEFWDTPDELKDFCKKFQQNLLSFYDALRDFADLTANFHQRLRVNGQVSENKWQEVMDSNCKVLLCKGDSRSKKPFALSILHSEEFKLKGEYDPNLCGKVRGEVKPSPVWISNPDKKYQVVTVFGATQDPRKKFVKKLSEQGAIQIFPLR